MMEFSGLTNKLCGRWTGKQEINLEWPNTDILLDYKLQLIVKCTARCSVMTL